MEEIDCHLMPKEKLPIFLLFLCVKFERKKICKMERYFSNTQEIFKDLSIGNFHD
jgi:hypothetical protein